MQVLPFCFLVPQVTPRGVSGEQVLVSMRERLEAELRIAEEAGSHYDYAVILAGINDIGHGATADDIFHLGLLHMYRVSVRVLHSMLWLHVNSR